MVPENFDLHDPRVQLLLAKEQLKWQDKLNTLQERLNSKVQEISYLKIALASDKKKTSKKRGKSRFLAFISSIVFLLSTLLCGFGISMLTSKPPDSQGWFMIVLGAAAYVIGAVMTTILAIEERD